MLIGEKSKETETISSEYGEIMIRLFNLLSKTHPWMLYGVFFIVTISLGYLSQTHETIALSLMGIFGITLIVLALKMNNYEAKEVIADDYFPQHNSILNNNSQVKNLKKEIQSLERKVVVQSNINSDLRREKKMNENNKNIIVQNITISDSAIAGDFSPQVNTEINEK